MPRYEAPTGYAPGGVSYYSSKPKRKVYAPPTGYAPGGVEYGPLKRKPKRKVTTTTYGGNNTGHNGTPIGKTATGEVVYQDPDTGQIFTDATRKVHESNDPVLAEIARREAAERAQAQADAGARSQSLATAFAGERAPTQALYDHAVTQAKGVEDAISAKFGKTGESNVADLKAKLDQIGGAAGADTATSVYQNADAANYALGMNDVARLVSRGAEAQNFLEREGLSAQRGVQADLAELLKEIGVDYGDQRFDITAHQPQQIQEMYDRMLADARGEAQGKYTRETEERDRVEEQKRYKDSASSAKAAAINDQYNKDRDYLQKERALTLSDPVRTKKIDKEIARLDRQAKKDIADANNLSRENITIDNNDTRIAVANKNAEGKKPRPGVVSSTLTKGSKYLVDETGTVMKDANGKKRVNPAYKPGTKSGDTAAGGRVRAKQARAQAIDAVSKNGAFTQDVLRKLKQHPNSADAIINTAINTAIRSAGIDPQSAEGKAIRAEVRGRLSGRYYKSGDKTYQFTA